jgi:hypothetical protein
MVRPEDAFAQAARHVAEAEARVARQEAIIAELDRDGHPAAAERARRILATLSQSLVLAREHLRIEHAFRDQSS